MKISYADRLLAALKRPEIPVWVQRDVFNRVFGAVATNVPRTAWRKITIPLLPHLASLRANKGTIHPDLLPVWQEYYDIVSAIPSTIRGSNMNEPPPAHKLRWQEWVDREVRQDLLARFNRHYIENPVRGKHIIPFIPYALRKENMQRADTLLQAIEEVRSTWNTLAPDTPDAPVSHTKVGALMLCAARQAERALGEHVKQLKDRSSEMNAYDHPIKSLWQHYCTPLMRERVKRAIRNPADVDLAGIKHFYSEER